MPLVAQATGEQVERIMSAGCFGYRMIIRGMKLGAPIGGSEDAILIATRLPALLPQEERPLLRAVGFQQAIAQSPDVEVAAHRQFAVLVEHRFG